MFIHIPLRRDSRFNILSVYKKKNTQVSLGGRKKTERERERTKKWREGDKRKRV